MKQKTFWLVVLFVLLGSCLLITAVAGGTVLYGGISQLGTQALLQTRSALATPTPVQPPTPTPYILGPTASQAALDALAALRAEEVPPHDAREWAVRIEGVTDLPISVPPPEVPPQIGDQETFTIFNYDTYAYGTRDATLQYIGQHVYFWVANGVNFNFDDMVALVDEFDNHIYPIDQQFFGSEWNPGIDNDPRLYILWTDQIGNVAGLFDSTSSYPVEVYTISNQHELFLLSAENLSLTDDYTLGTMAHEFQHMIHWYRDVNEVNWVNEGFSELAILLNEYGAGGFESRYAANPDLQLNTWTLLYEDEETTAHYGQASMFMTYFLDRFGYKATQGLVSRPQNSLDGVDEVLHWLDLRDPGTHNLYTADDVFTDWAIANLVMDGTVPDGRFTYHNYPGAPTATITETVEDCPLGEQERYVHQYGVDYISIQCNGTFTINFKGEVEVNLLPMDTHDGAYFFWSNTGGEIDTTLTREFDFTNISAPLTLQFDAWYDRVNQADERFVFISLDGGATWEMADEFYGGNGRWTQQQVDLDAYAGQKVLVRFEYTDYYDSDGFAVDNISIPETGYFEDFESSDGGWDGNGFVRLQNVLPQEFRLSLIQRGGSSPTLVQYISLRPDQSTSIPITLGNEYTEAILVVSGITRYTRSEAGYKFSIAP